MCQHHLDWLCPPRRADEQQTMRTRNTQRENGKRKMRAYSANKEITSRARQSGDAARTENKQAEARDSAPSGLGGGAQSERRRRQLFQDGTSLGSRLYIQHGAEESTAHALTQKKTLPSAKMERGGPSGRRHHRDVLAGTAAAKRCQGRDGIRSNLPARSDDGDYDDDVDRRSAAPPRRRSSRGNSRGGCA